MSGKDEGRAKDRASRFGENTFPLVLVLAGLIGTPLQYFACGRKILRREAVWPIQSRPARDPACWCSHSLP